MKIAVTGATGLIGSALAGDLARDGHQVLRLVRKDPSGPGEVRWNPYGTFDPAALEGLDAVVHLAGAGVGDRRWTAARKQEVRDSRVLGTRSLATALAGLAAPPRVLVSGSAIGFYGDTHGREVDERDPAGAGFLAALTRDWEAAAEPAAEAGIRVVTPRTGLVLTAAGGLLGKVLPLFRLGLGGPLGGGRQWMSWITLTDEVAALRFLIDTDALAGPVNLVAPVPVTNAVYTRELGRALGRPAVLPVPAAALRLALGGFADEGPLVSQRVRALRLTEAGFAFRHPELPAALAALLGGDLRQDSPKTPR